ncbi:hypothetical protein LX36DRAFT_373333 [Colletotrichum falcatum]|nr:hypothetical protein LX36DRAFT_373333 [Colletotrichum falcatum]
MSSSRAANGYCLSTPPARVSPAHHQPLHGGRGSHERPGDGLERLIMIGLLWLCWPLPPDLPTMGSDMRADMRADESKAAGVRVRTTRERECGEVVNLGTEPGFRARVAWHDIKAISWATNATWREESQVNKGPSEAGGRFPHSLALGRQVLTEASLGMSPLCKPRTALRRVWLFEGFFCPFVLQDFRTATFRGCIWFLLRSRLLTFIARFVSKANEVQSHTWNTPVSVQMSASTVSLL